MPAPQPGPSGLFSPSTDPGVPKCPVAHQLGRSGGSDVRDLRVARPGGPLPGVTVVVTRADGSETALMSLALDLLPSSAAAHERLRGIAADLLAPRVLDP